MFWGRKIWALRADLNALRHQVEELPNLTDENRLFLAQQTEARRLLSYQQAADWLRMTNNITWTLSSVYLVAAIIGLNSGLTVNDPDWRLWIGLTVTGLGLSWLLVDIIYFCSASNARQQLRAIEQNMEERFYTTQRGTVSRVIVTAVLLVSMLGVSYMGLVVAKPRLQERLPWMSGFILNSPPAKQSRD